MQNTIFRVAFVGSTTTPIAKARIWVLLEPDVAEVFKDSATVNSALRTLVKIARDHASKPTNR